ncbi:aminotransferase class V-fold PLP-dependent enzyme [Tepidicaulis sp. LMO-SS28]|uniref:aminotransferase class V-fold PLP-dependent enzyme n=1 Tax=Tepidicaulis sp. LMO-SS28 TaxID=3447455 RepID=UPI003EE083A9
MSTFAPIPSQRHLFDIPEDITYLNCAYMGPLPRPSLEAGHGGIEAKARPWQLRPADFFDEAEEVRTLVARMMNTGADNIAIVPAASYGMAIALKNLPLAPAQEILALKDQFPSNVYPWMRLSEETGATLRLIPAPETNGPGIDWTPAILDAISDRTAILALPHCHWTDGALIDLEAIGKKARAHGAALAVDLTQSLGALPFDAEKIQPDIAVAASYKWLLGPYSLGAVYVSPRWHEGRPVEENWINRKGSEDFTRLVDYQYGYQPGARRFDMGERANFHLMPVFKKSLEMLLGWGVENIAATLAAKTEHLAKGANALGLNTAPATLRAGHFLGVRFPGGTPDGLLEKLREKNIYVSLRGTSMRVTPHLYNTEEELDRLLEALKEIL